MIRRSEDSAVTSTADSGRRPDPGGHSTANTVATWIQVILGGLGVSVAIAALVIAYFAWIRPHSPPGETAAPSPVPGATNAAAETGALPQHGSAPATSGAAPTATPPGDALTSLTPVFGGHNVRTTGADLTIACPTGQTNDLRRTVEYDLLGKYRSLDVELQVAKARDADTPLQWKVFTDGQLAANHVLKRGTPVPVQVDLTGKQKLRLQVTCQFPDGEMTLRNPTLPR
ncbi:NPCBM/NEW2 domain-containing protein [Actinoplanes sp. NPDC051861]|uniref:NPCBM/NEW2 domain-containing protein n=1 Tax=Actinoplanes sp. NPDC051861 TaxID=3155170 RepID=UPI00343A6D62